MPRHFILEDDLHAEWCSQHVTLDDAVAELKRRASLRWDDPINRAPCGSWRTCGREYRLREYETTHEPWSQIAEHAALDLHADGLIWVKRP